MLQWIGANLATILISIALLGIVSLVIHYLLRQKKAGKSSCGCNCAQCPMHDTCHSRK